MRLIDTYLGLAYCLAPLTSIHLPSCAKVHGEASQTVVVEI